MKVEGLVEIKKIALQDRQWIDCTHLNLEQLKSLCESIQLKVEDLDHALEFDLLPQLRVTPGMMSLILRLVEQSKKSSADSLKQLTTKLSIFITDKYFITIHRLDLKFVADLVEKNESQPTAMKQVLQTLIESSLHTFDHPLSVLEAKGEQFEANIFSPKKMSSLFKQGLLLKRRSSAYKKTLKFTIEAINKLSNHNDFKDLNFDEIKENINRYLFYTDEILENVTSLLNLHISILSHKTNDASFRTNEIMRVLTVFSIFFLPLNFITGLYGMNFEFMPELKSEKGYFIVLSVMGLISSTLFFWIKKQGWLSPGDLLKNREGV